MSKWSRARLWLSILTCEGLFATLRERVQWAPPIGRITKRPLFAQKGVQPRYYDYAGGIHVHSTYSDGLGSVSDVAEAAAIAGLDFVALCDHSNLDALKSGEAGWHGHALMLVGTEITTDHGHLLALDVPASFLPAPNPAVETQKAVQDCGGFGVIALPCDLKDHWKDFSIRREGIGLEVFNLSSIARAKISLPGFILAWLTYKGNRPQRAFHWVAARPVREIRLWDELITSGPDGSLSQVVGIASLDAHAVMKVARRSYPIPTYEELFRTLRTHVLTEKPLAGYRAPDSSERDCKAIHKAIAAGHCYMAYDNYGDSSGFTFEAEHKVANKDMVSIMGDKLSLPKDETQENTILLTAKSPRKRTLLHLYRNGERIMSTRGGRLEFAANEQGAYRIEAYLYRRRFGRLCLGVKPWVFTNPIYIT